MRRWLWVVAALLLAGCTNVKAGDPAASFATPSPVDPGELPTDELVWTVSSGGGMMPPNTWDSDLPEMAIYGDGTAYFATWDDEIVTVEVGSVDPDELHDLLADAAGSGLFEDVDFGTPTITDMTTTAVKAFYDGQLHVASAYALNTDSGITGKQKKARAQLIELMDQAGDIVTDLASYDEPDQVEVYVVDDPDWDGDDGQPWPGPALTTFLTEDDQTCGELTGTDAATAYQAFLDSEGKFLVDGQPTKLHINILLPGMTACDD